MSERLLPCPFCGSTDLEILPEDPSRDGDAWGAVQCVNVDCSTYDILKSHGVRVEDGQDVSDERGSDAYKSAAIAAWNRRTPAPEGEAVDRVMAVLNYWFDGSRRIDRNSEKVAQLAALASPVVPAPEGEAWTARHIVFDGPPDHNGPRFIEVETPEGKSVNAGEWRQRPDNLWELVIASPVVPVGVSREEIARALFERHWSAVSASPKWPGDDDGSYWLWLADAILAALRPADTGWRDIATAPKDGTEVLLWTGRFARAASFRRGRWYACGASRPYLRPIAHWMPLPPPPSVSIGSRPQEAVPTEQAEPAVLDWKEAASGLCAAVLKQAPLQIEKVSELLYEGLLNDVQAYLRENVGYNLSGELKRANRDADRANTALQSVAIVLGVDTHGFPNYPTPEMVDDQCRAVVAKLQAKATPQPADGCSSNEGAVS